MTDTESSALVALVKSVKDEISNLRSDLGDHRAEVRNELTGIRADAVLRSEYDATIRSLGRSVDELRGQITQEIADRKQADRDHQDDDRATLDKHERRIAALDQFKWLIVGCAIGGGGLAGTAATALLHTH